MSSGCEAQTAAPTPWQMSGALPPAGLQGDAFPPPASPRPTPAPPSLPQPSRDLRVLAGQKRGTEAETLLGAGSPSPFSASAPLLVGGGVIKPGPRVPKEGRGIPRLPRINVCRSRAAAPTPASQEPHRGSPHCALWPAWGECLAQGSRILTPGSPSPTSQRSFQTWIPLEPLPPLSQGLPERKWGHRGPLAMAMLSS